MSARTRYSASVVMTAGLESRPQLAGRRRVTAHSIEGGRVSAAWLVAVAALTLFAVVVRAVRLDFVNFHSDEAFFIQIAYQGTFMRSMSIDEPHPPLFLALLQAWMGAAGVSEYAIRMLPVLFGTLLVPPVYKLGCLIGSR